MIRSTVLRNGTRVITNRMEGTRTAALHVHFEAGAWDTNDDNEGVAHFLEHMMFKEADGLKGTDLSRRLRELGVSENAWTWFAETVYHIQGIGGEDFYTATELFCKMVSSTKWTKKELENEKSIIVEELNRAKDDTFYVLCEEQYRHLYGRSHPISRTELGNEQQIMAITTKKLKDFHKKYYNHNNCVVVAAGDICHDDIVKAVEGSLSLSFGDKNQRDIKDGYLNENRLDMIHDCEQAYVSFLVPVKTKATMKNRLILDLVSDILGGGMSSRLFEYVREELGLAYAVHSRSVNERGRLLLEIMCGTSHDKVNQATDAISLITSQLLEEGISSYELRLAKLNILKQLVYSDESSNGTTGRMRVVTINDGDPVELKTIEELVKSITLDEVNKYISKIKPKYFIGTIRKEVEKGGE